MSKPWPVIANFLSSLSTGSVGLDSGTGNGKYLPLPADRPGCVLTVGLDRSKNLLEIARRAGGDSAIREVVWGDALGHPWRDGAFVRGYKFYSHCVEFNKGPYLCFRIMQFQSLLYTIYLHPNEEGSRCR